VTHKIPHVIQHLMYIFCHAVLFQVGTSEHCTCSQKCGNLQIRKTKQKLNVRGLEL